VASRFCPLRRSASLVAALSLAIVSGCAAAPLQPETAARGDYGQTREALSRLVAKEMKKHDVRGLSIALVDDQDVVWSRGFGDADAERGIPATDQTVYGIGSVTKLFTALAVLQLVERGRVDLDAPLSRYVPEFSLRARFAAAPPITVRNLLTHHGGLPGDYLKGMWTLHPAPFAQLIPQLKEEYASYPPDLVYSYSNLGYSLLGSVIEKASGQDYATYVREAVLTPLGMSRSSFGVRPDGEAAPAVGYRKGRPGAERYLLRDVPAGALFSNVRDLSRFIAMAFAGGQAGTQRVVRVETLHEMWRAQNAGVALDMDLRVGLGWMLGQPGLDHAGPVVSHSGGTLGSASQLMLLPEHKLGVIVLANSPAGSRMLTGIAVQALKLALAAKTGIRETVRPTPAGREPAAVSPGVLAELAGNYASNFGVVFTVVDKGGYLQTQFQGRTFALLPRADGTFAVQYRLFGWLPVDLAALKAVALSAHDIAGSTVLAIHYEGKRFLAAVRIAPRPVPQSWLQRAGRYVIANQGEDGTLVENLELAYENGLLVLKYTLPEAPDYSPGIALDPIGDDEAITPGYGRFMGETLRAIVVQGQPRLLYSGYELARVPAGRND
jgi:CubicO group peptidase (beta-lactamase class C family)